LSSFNTSLSFSIADASESTGIKLESVESPQPDSESTS
jgi:hypothetical protein